MTLVRAVAMTSIPQAALDRYDRPRRLLMITNVDRGEANVFLATTHALLQVDPFVEVHFASFTELEAEVSLIWQHTRRLVPEAKEIVFHSIRGLPMAEGLHQYFQSNRVPMVEGYLPSSFLVPPGLSNTTRAICDAIPIFVPYDGPELVRIFWSIISIIKTVGPDLVVVDSLMTPALTACYHLGIKFACLSPNSIKDFAAPLQRYGASLWKYPALFSGFPYPIPWYLIPLNMFYVLYTASTYIQDKHRRDTATYLKIETGATLRTPVDLIWARPNHLKVLVSTLPELDFAVAMPSHILPCGPIILAGKSVFESDPALYSWLSKRATIYVNLGSICRLDEDRAAELASALKLLFAMTHLQGGRPDFQVLWKLKKYGEYKIFGVGSRIYSILSYQIDSDLVRIVDWLVARPAAILQSGTVVCAVHHGGANSFNEAIISGVPQVVLPQWTDCYDYSQKVEMLGVGRQGNRKAQPEWSAGELSDELFRVVFGQQAECTRRKAKEIAATCRNRGDGAINAARILLVESEGM